MSEVASWLAISVIGLAVAEYAIHRWVMHRKGSASFVRHTVFHHGRFYRDRFDRDPDPIARHFNIDLDVGYALLLASPIWLALLLCGRGKGAAALASCVAAHATAWTMLHREMHDPRGRRWAATRWYRALRDHHERHHGRPGTNFSAVFAPWMDVLMGTRATSSPPPSSCLIDHPIRVSDESCD